MTSRVPNSVQAAPGRNAGRGSRVLAALALLLGAARRQHAHPSRPLSSTAICRSRRTRTRRSSSSRGCRVCSRPRSSAAASRSPASCSRRSCATRWHRPTRSACRPARRSARCCAITFHANFSMLGVSAVPLASFAGSLGALGIVYGLSRARRRGTPTMVLLLAGVTLTALLSAVVRFVQYLADFTETFQTMRWMMGSLDVASYAPIVAALVPMTLAWTGFATLPRVLDLISLGHGIGRRARRGRRSRTERVALVSASLSTGAAVSLGGPVAFVGIIVPHLVRLMVGADHRLVLPAAGALRRGVSDRLRSGRTDGVRAARAARRNRHGHHRRARFSYGCCSGARDARSARHGAAWLPGLALLIASAVPSSQNAASVLTVSGQRRRRSRRARRSASSRSFPPPPRCCSRWTRATASSASSNYDRFPAEVEQLPRVGGLLDPTVERILSLKPDLVIVYDTQSRLEAGARARGHPAVPVHAPRTARHHADAFGRSASAPGRETRPSAAAPRHRAGARRHQVAGRADGPGRRTLLVFGREPGALRNVQASGGYGFLHDLLELAGGADVLGDIKRQSVQMSAEMILARAPDVIIELHYGESLPAESARRGEGRSGMRCPRCRPSGTTASTCSSATSSSSLARASFCAAERLARTLHPDLVSTEERWSSWSSSARTARG